MNPIYDLIVIGVIVSMVLLNLYFSRESQKAASYWTELSEKLNASNPFGHKSVLSSSHGSMHFSQD